MRPLGVPKKPVVTLAYQLLSTFLHPESREVQAQG